MRISLYTDELDTVNAPANSEDPTTQTNLDYLKKAMAVA